MALKVLKAIQSLARAWPPRGPRAALASIRWLRWSNARRPTMGPHDLTLVGTRRRNRPSASKKSTSHVPPPHGSRRPPLPETPIRCCRGEIDLGGGSGVWELELGSWRPIRQRQRELLCSGGAGEARLRRLTAAAVSQSRTLSPLRRRRELRAPLYCDGGACSRSSPGEPRGGRRRGLELWKDGEARGFPDGEARGRMPRDSGSSCRELSAWRKKIGVAKTKIECTSPP